MESIFTVLVSHSAVRVAYGRLERISEAAEKQENDDDRKSESQSTCGGVTPLPAMRPSRQCTQERENQDHNQYCSKHGLLLLSCIQQKEFRPSLSRLTRNSFPLAYDPTRILEKE
jgi:hypothetical protein